MVPDLLSGCRLCPRDTMFQVLSLRSHLQSFTNEFRVFVSDVREAFKNNLQKTYGIFHMLVNDF